ncbi:MAG: SET domain-containing protein [Planctomycetota bacterium]
MRRRSGAKADALEPKCSSRSAGAEALESMCRIRSAGVDAFEPTRSNRRARTDTQRPDPLEPDPLEPDTQEPGALTSTRPASRCAAARTLVVSESTRRTRRRQWRRALAESSMRSKVRPVPLAPHDGVYARIGPSRIHGVGAIAVRDIPRGARVFAGEVEQVAWVRRDDVRRLPRAMRSLYEDFGMVDGAWLGVPKNLNRLSVGWYVNHADVPNLAAGEDGRFRALRRIRAGEELTADYRTFVDEPLPFRARASRRTRRPR